MFAALKMMSCFEITQRTILLLCLLKLQDHDAIKTCLRGFANNTGADQPAHLRSLISVLVIRFLESAVCKLLTCKISIF